MKTMRQTLQVGSILIILLTACGQNSLTTPSTPNPPAQKYRPATSPDVYVLGISGKCFLNSEGIACANLMPASKQEDISKQNAQNNWDYLGAILPGQTDSTLHDLAFTIHKQGNSVLYKGYAGSWPDTTNTTTGQQYDGVKTLLAELQAIYTRDIQDVMNPSKIVLVSHSHGVVWSHIVQWALPKVPIEVAIDFDGICRYWGTDNAADITRDGNPYNIPVSSLCGQQITGGGNPYDIQNVVFSNVKFNLDIQASNTASCNPYVLLGVYDGHDNIRNEGGTEGIYAFNTCEDHGSVIRPDRSGTKVARDMLRALFPLH